MNQSEGIELRDNTRMLSISSRTKLYTRNNNTRLQMEWEKLSCRILANIMYLVEYFFYFLTGEIRHTTLQSFIAMKVFF